MTALLLAAVLSGPVPCSVVRVLDGDTIEVTCAVWIDTEVRTMVRVRGVDTPEKRGKCPEESELAAKASAFTKTELPVGAAVMLTTIGEDKYGGRVVAQVETPAGDLGKRLIAAGLARGYDGGTKSSWCH